MTGCLYNVGPHGDWTEARHCPCLVAPLLFFAKTAHFLAVLQHDELSAAQPARLASMMRRCASLCRSLLLNSPSLIASVPFRGCLSSPLPCLCPRFLCVYVRVRVRVCVCGTQSEQPERDQRLDREGRRYDRIQRFLPGPGGYRSRAMVGLHGAVLPT